MRFDDIVETSFGIGTVVLIVGVTLIFFAVMVDMVQDYRSEPQQIACRAKREEHVRRSFTTNVYCVPVLMRRDTITVNTR